MLILDVFKTHADVQEAYLRMSVLVETVFTLVNFSPDQPEVGSRTWPFLLTLYELWQLCPRVLLSGCLLAAVWGAVGTGVLCA